MTTNHRAWMLLSLLAAGCAASPPDTAHPAAAAANAHPPIPATEPGDDALSCQAIESQIGEMNGRIDQANQRTRALASSGVAGSGVSLSGGSGGGVSGANVNENNLPVIGSTGSGGIDNGGSSSATNEDAIAAQQRFANSAIARANRLIVLGRARKCFA